MMQVNLQAVPIDENTYAIECDLCGPVGTEDHEAVNTFAFRHLKDHHGVLSDEDIEWGLGPTGTP